MDTEKTLATWYQAYLRHSRGEITDAQYRAVCVRPSVRAMIRRIEKTLSQM